MPGSAGKITERKARDVGASLVDARMNGDRNGLKEERRDAMVPIQRTHFPVRQTEALHKGRVSLPGTRYFVTCSAMRPESRLVNTPAASELSRALVRLEDDGDCVVLCSTIMPDHAHIILRQTGRLTIGRTVGKLKSLFMRTSAANGIKWQRDFFEHRLRPEDDVTGFARYVFMNPYRAGLISTRHEWRWWRRGDGECMSLERELLDGKLPPEEWLPMSPEQMGIRTEDVGEQKSI